LIDILDILLNGIKDKEKEEVINIKEKKNLTERVKKKYSYILEVY